MNTKSISAFFKKVETQMVKHSPEILTGIGITGMITAGVMAVKATPKALDLLSEIHEKEAELEMDKKEVSKEIITKVAPVYIPSVLITGMSIACLIGATSVNNRRTAALATAYSLSESALKEYQEKVIETFGEKKERGVRDAIAKDKIDRNPVSNSEVYITKKGDTLCYDTISGRYFKSDIDKIKKIENELNRKLISEMYISLNEFYYELGLQCTKNGNDLGWNVGDGLINIRFSAQIAEDDTPCIVLDYDYAPRYDFRNLM